MLSAVLCTLVGVVGTLAAGYYFYQRARRDQEKTGSRRQTPSESLDFIQRCLDSGDAVVHPFTGRVACPECGTSSKEFRETVLGGDDNVTIVSFSCPNCLWEETMEF